MKLEFKESFLIRLNKQIDFIAKDSSTRARKFKNNLINRIKEIPKRPLSYRKSIYFDDDKIRDLIYKGYTIVFRITNERIEIFGFVKFQKEPID